MSICHRISSGVSSAAVTGLLLAGLGACSDDPERDESGEFTDSGDADVFTLAVGDCLSGESPTGDVGEVPVIPCDQPHESEIYFSYTFAGDEMPTPDAMAQTVDEQCLTAFQTFVGLPYDQSVLEITTLEPTTESWADGDRELLCLVFDPAGGVTGTLAAAGR